MPTDAKRMRMTDVAGTLPLPDCWIGTGFVRDTVSNALHGFPSCFTLSNHCIRFLIWLLANAAPSWKNNRSEI